MTAKVLEHLSCDRCGFKQSFRPSDQFTRTPEKAAAGWRRGTSIINEENSYFSPTVDLCPNCWTQYQEWWKNPTPRLKVVPNE